MIPVVQPIFTQNNQLKIDISNHNLNHGEFKFCFSLVYSIISIEGAVIVKKVGRYYELNTNQNTIYLTLQPTRIKSYNLSCGPEGVFIINKNEKHLQVALKTLIFENEIKPPSYENIYSDNFNPIIPEPQVANFKNQFINLKNLNIKINSANIDFFEVFLPYSEVLDINFNIQEGFPLIFTKIELKDEEYKIEVNENKIEIFYNNYAGKFYAIISLIQLIHFYKNKLPYCNIEDKPTLKWRGMHLDCARQFYSVNEIKRLLSYMALFKLNRFHWHLTDNEAWRIELDCYPSLTSIGAFRGYNQLIPPFYGSGYSKCGGYYSKKDIIELIEFAKKINIEIMPEIDLPAHSWTLLQIKPELRDQSQNLQSEDVGNYPNNTINPSVEETSIFLKNILNEISQIFAFEVVHVGVDERPRQSWEGSPKVIEFMKKNNLKNFDELQDFYMNNIISILKNNKKRTAAWNEAALPPHNDIGSSGSSGQIDKSCLIFAWEHPDVAIESLKKGFETIICPGQKTYFDMAYNNSTSERGICWAATIEVKEIHEWKPIEGVAEDKKQHVKGIQGQLWSETITKKEYFDSMINPRLATLAEIAWRSKSFRNWTQFRSSLLNSVELLSKMGWKFHKF